MYKLLFIIVSLILAACSASTEHSNTQTNSDNTENTVAQKENFEKGKIIENVVCKNDSSQNYCLYLPSNYSTEKTFPVVITFDPHGNGKTPVDNYKELAEKHNYIIAGSNNSKNGLSWEESSQIASNLIADVKNRLAANTDRIYLMGFSGGARIANAITMTDGSIAGVICCGAASPAMNPNNKRTNYSFIGIIGTADFNYVEMCKYDMTELNGLKHTLIKHEGKHEWAPDETVDEAFLFLELNEMRRNLSYKNDSLINKNIDVNLKELKTLQAQNKTFEVFEKCKKTINYYNGLANLDFFMKMYESLKSNKEIDEKLRIEEAFWKLEEKTKQEYMQAMQSKEFSWWQNDIASLNKKIKTGKNRSEVEMQKRVLGFLSLANYMQTNAALKQNNIPAAEHFCNIYQLVDPENNEAYYLMANIYAMKGMGKEALDELKESVKYDFKDMKRAESDPTFKDLKNTKEFENVIEKMKK